MIIMKEFNESLIIISPFKGDRAHAPFQKLEEPRQVDEVILINFLVFRAIFTFL